MTTTDPNIYLGSRDEDFKKLIITILTRGRLKPKYIDLLTNEKSMAEYGNAFTAESADTVNNYERYEQLGDISANKFIVWYSYKRFPQLDCTEGVKVVARLRINYGATQMFSKLAEELGFWPFISCAIDPPPVIPGEERKKNNKKYRSKHMKNLLEDVFEAFIGCTETLLDKAFRTGVGYAIVYDILTDIFNEKPMSLVYEDLYDSKTRLKETFDHYNKKKVRMGEWVYRDEKEVTDPDSICCHGLKKHSCEECFLINSLNISYVYHVPVGGSTKFLKNEWIIGVGKSTKKIDAEQIAAEEGINNLRKIGYYKHPPAIYSFFCKK
jgi:dsRNA-specific ribonuclease